MSRHLDKILANADRQLAATGTHRPTDVLPLYKKFLKIEEHRLRLKHQAGGGGREICAGRAELVDVLLKHVFGQAKAVTKQPGKSGPIALMALGGYGRSELNPFSDVDVMFLHRQNGAPCLTSCRRNGRANSLFAVGHRFQGRPFDTIDQGSNRPGQSRYVDEDGNARSRVSSPAMLSSSSRFAHSFAANALSDSNANIWNCA